MVYLSTWCYEMSFEIRIGEEEKKEYIVVDKDCPDFLRDKDICVLSTPRMIALMEITAKELLDKFLDQDHTSVGFHIDVYHKAPAPVGSKLVFKVRVVGVKKNKIVFRVKCLMGDVVVGEGIHERAIVSWSKFAESVKKYLSK